MTVSLVWHFPKVLAKSGILGSICTTLSAVIHYGKEALSANSELLGSIIEMASVALFAVDKG